MRTTTVPSPPLQRCIHGGGREGGGLCVALLVPLPGSGCSSVQTADVITYCYTTPGLQFRACAMPRERRIGLFNRSFYEQNLLCFYLAGPVGKAFDYL